DGGAHQGHTRRACVRVERPRESCHFRCACRLRCSARDAGTVLPCVSRTAPDRLHSPRSGDLSFSFRRKEAVQNLRACALIRVRFLFFQGRRSGDAEPLHTRTLGANAGHLSRLLGLDLTPNEGYKPRLAAEIAARDVFLLFWSRNARASQWVRWEFETARVRPGMNAILPMPLEDPSLAPPPQGFEDKHLRDRFMIAGYGLKKIAEIKGSRKV